MKLGSCLSMDGRRHENGENWHDGCRDCYCHNGREMCALISCPVPACESPTIRPGQCCPSCPGERGGQWGSADTGRLAETQTSHLA